MRKALIDLGSNSFKLLIAEFIDAFLHKHLEDKVFVNLPSFDGTASLSQKSNLIMDALLHLVEIAKKNGANDIVLVATSYFRPPERELQLRDMLEKQGMDFPLYVISGKKEAYLIAEGVLAEVPDENFLVMDIGGGSVEFIALNKRKITSVRSFDIGVRRWAEKFNDIQGLQQNEIKEITHHLDQEVAHYLNEVKPTLLVGAAGSFETFYSLLRKRSFLDKEASNYILCEDELKPLLKFLMKASIEERKAHPFIENDRVRYIAYAALLTDFVLKKTQVKNIKIATHALKEGAFLHYLA